ncbi:Uncharacterised protein [Mycobacteroides abscessus subsp. abscessus]|nr:Uncharacterised protein [Mycobacteroides abscessus subsp. abscessus]
MFSSRKRALEPMVASEIEIWSKVSPSMKT